MMITIQVAVATGGAARVAGSSLVGASFAG